MLLYQNKIVSTGLPSTPSALYPLYHSFCITLVASRARDSLNARNSRRTIYIYAFVVRLVPLAPVAPCCTLRIHSTRDTLYILFHSSPHVNPLGIIRRSSGVKGLACQWTGTAQRG
jgi:hypothetical protein